MALFLAYNGSMQTTAVPAKVTTGTGTKTMLQLKGLTGIDLIVKEWGCSFDGSAAATPGVIELVETDVAATVTAYATADIARISNPAGPAADTGLISLGTAASGFTASAEGATTVLRNLASPQLISPTNQYQYQWVLGNEPLLQAGKFLRIRMTFAAAINAFCYVIFEAA